MLSPGHACCGDDGSLIIGCDPSQAGEAAGVVHHLLTLVNVGDAVLQDHEDVGAQVLTDAVASAEILIDPRPHGGVA